MNSELFSIPAAGGFLSDLDQDFTALPQFPSPAPYAVESTVGFETASAVPNRDQMLLEHLPTVRYLARRIHERLPQHVDLDDLISAGVVGLIDAFSKFDHSKKVQFKSYAQFRIRGAILDSLRTLDWSPRELRRKGQGSGRGHPFRHPAPRPRPRRARDRRRDAPRP